MGLFDKKFCSICGDKIGLLGNRKLTDGNLCKNCAAKLSPWFSERRNSSTQEIREQLEYREANRGAVASFHVTKSLGDGMRLLLDEDRQQFVVTRARDLVEANPDVLSFSQVTGVEIDIDEDRSEVKTKDREGKPVSYNPPRYVFSYDFDVIISVNHPYFNEIRYQLNPSGIKINPDAPVPANRAMNPRLNRDYREYEALANEIKSTLQNVRRQVREEIRAAAAPKQAVTCPWCGATTTPDASGCCEYCGGAVNA